MEVGEKGLAFVNLTIPQKCSLSFELVHKDENGQIVDHSSSDIHMQLQSKDGKTSFDFSSYVSASATGIVVSIPASATENLPLGLLNWDIIAELESETIRLAYGAAEVVDTYALDVS